MTGQMNDVFQYRGNDYSISGISEGELFDITRLGLRPSMATTACWRGYVTHFALANSFLTLDGLDVNLVRIERPDPNERAIYISERGPAINGVEPTVERQSSFDPFSNHYSGLNHHLPYSGGLLLARGFLDNLYVHMGFQSAWKYEEIIELIFEAGKLVAEFDRSAQMADLRNRYVESRNERNPDGRSMTEDEIRQFVERAFDRTYRL